MNLEFIFKVLDKEEWQKAKQTVLGSGQATPSLHQGLLPEPTIQPI